MEKRQLLSPFSLSTVFLLIKLARFISRGFSLRDYTLVALPLGLRVYICTSLHHSNSIFFGAISANSSHRLSISL